MFRKEATAQRAIAYAYPESRRYDERSTAERVNARLKDEFSMPPPAGAGTGRQARASRLLMFGILALTVNRLFRVAL